MISLDPNANDAVEVVSGEGIYAVLLVSRDGGMEPIAIRHLTKGDVTKYPVISHPNSGHNVNLAERLNARFGLNPETSPHWFVSYLMRPDVPADLDPNRKIYQARVRRITYRPGK